MLMQTPLQKRRLVAWGACGAGLLGAGLLTAHILSAASSGTIEIGTTEINSDSGIATFSNIAISLPFGTTIRIGEAAFNGWSIVSPAQAAENVTIKNLSFDVGRLRYIAPSIEIVGSSFTQKDMAAFREASGGAAFPARLASFAAASIAIPEVTLELQTGPRRDTAVFRKVIFGRVSAGKAVTVTADGGTLTSGQKLTTSYGPMEIKNLDLSFLARLLAETPASEDQPKLLFASATIDKVDYIATPGLQFAIGRLSISDAKLQPGQSRPHLLPVMGQIKASNMMLTSTSGQTGAATKWAIKDLTLVSDVPRDGVPTQNRLLIEDVTVDLPKDSTVPQVRGLIDLGYDSISFSLRADGEWNPQTSEFNVKQMAIDSGNLGAITLRGVLGNVTKDSFLATTADSRPGYKNSTIKTMSVTIENKGLFDRIVVREAKKRGKSLDDTRRTISIAMVSAVTNMTADIVDETVPRALIKFAAKPGRLNVSAKSKASAGIPIGDLNQQSGGKPAIAGKMEVSASAD